MRKYIFILALLCAPAAWGASYTASSCSLAAIAAADPSPLSGDIINVPARSSTAGNGAAISFSVAVSIIGPSSQFPGFPAPFPPVEPTTGCIITDNDTTDTYLLTMNTDGTHHATLANMNFVLGTGTAKIFLLQDGTGSPNLVPIVHDISINEMAGISGTQIANWFTSGGVGWNLWLYSTFNLGGNCSTSPNIGNGGGSVSFKQLNNAWDNPSTFGSLDTTGTSNVYIENSIFEYVGQTPDIDDNGRVVIRYSQFVNSSGLNHGTTSTYGGRQAEMYANSYSWPNTQMNPSRYFWMRGGTGVFHDNVFTLINTGGCYGTHATLQFVVENAQANAGHGCATGYMGFHQPGSGASSVTQSPSYVGPGSPAQTPGDVFQLPDPVYVWNNTGSGAFYSSTYSYNQGSTGGACGNTNPATGNLYSTSDFFIANRDIFVDQGTRPGYSTYTYPHPLDTGATPMNAPPVFGVLQGTYPTTQTVSISDPLTSGATIFYTADGSTPTHTGGTPTGTTSIYSTALTISSTTTLNALAYKSGNLDSFVATGVWTITGNPQLATPTLTAPSGTFPQTITLGNCTGGPTCYYTTDGSFPTSSSTIYSAPFSVTEAMNVNAVAIQSGHTNSLIGQRLYLSGASTVSATLSGTGISGPSLPAMAYLPCTVRLHFYANRTDVKMQTVCPRNAQQPSSLTAPGSDFQTAAKQYKSAELVETWNPSGGTTNWGIGNHTTTPTSGTLSGSNVVDLYQGYSGKHLSQDVGSQLVNCSGTIADACYTSPISRTGSPGSWTYAQSGYQINSGAVGSQTNIVTGSSAQYPAGWADVDDGTKGVEIGVEDLAGNWPKALGLAKGGTEVHIGIAPDQSLFLGGGGQDYVCNYTAYCGDTNTVWYFHAGTLSSSSYAAAREEFLDFQHPLIARAPVGYYNQACQLNGPVCFFPNQIPDPVAEDTYLTSSSPHLNCGYGTTTPGTCLDDVQDSTQAGTQPTPMSVFTAYNWGQSGAGNQHDVMEAFLQNWVQRGYTNTTGSVPGHYAFGRNFIRNVADRALPHSDWSGSLGNNGWRMLCTGTPSAPACPANTFDNWGWPAKVNSILPAGAGTANMGMRNWCDEITSEDHCWPWAIVDWYFLTGDRNLYDSIRQGGYDRFNLQLGYNNGLAGPNPGHGNMGVTRATGHSLSWIARLCEFSLDTSDATNFPCPAVSGPSKSTGIALAGENILAYVVQNPLIDAGYPVGATDASGCPDNSIGGQGTAACSAGISPVRGLHYGGESGDFIATIPISGITGDGAGHATAVCATTCGGLVNGSSILVSGITPTTFDCAPISCASIASVAGTTLTINYVSTAPSGSGTASGNGAQPSGSGPMQVDAHLPPGDATNHGTIKAFMESVFEEGVFEFCQMEEYVRGYDWNGVAFTGVANGTSSATQTLDDRSCLQRAYAVGNYMDQEHFQPAASWNPGGIGYDNFFHYLNATPPGFNGANAKISLPNGAANATNYGDWGYGLCGVVGPKAGIPSTFAATPNLWQPDYELYQSLVQSIGNSYPQERYSHMAYATDSCILNGSANPNQYAPDTTTSTLQPVQGFTVTDGTNSGFCVGSATCTINWASSSSLAILGSALNKNPTPYWLVQNSCTVGSSGCPSSGLQIVNWENFHNNCQTGSTTIECTNGTGLVANNPCNGGMNAVADPTTGQSPGCWEAGVTPDTHVNFFAATPVYPQPTASATSATFTCATGQVCTAALYAYQQQPPALSSVTLTPTNQTFASSPIGVTSVDSPETFTLTNSSGSIVTAISISLTGADASDYSDAIPATTCSTTLAIGASCQIFVSFTPLATGLRTATLSILDSDSSSPQSSSLFGTAIPPVINPTPANPITFGVAITDPSIPSTVKNENQKQYESFASGRVRNRGITAKQSLLEGCPLVENHAGAGAASATGNCAARDSSEINSAYNFSHIDLFGFLHQERPGYAAGASAR